MVIGITLFIVLGLAKSTYYINYWPSDSQNPYIPTAARLFELKFLSDMHDVPVSGQLKITMRGKEALILGIAVMQRLLNDTETLYPNVLLLIFATGISAVLIYFIFDRLFNPAIGLVAYILFAGCFWPYLYILQGAHQPLVLMNCLITLWILIKAESSLLKDWLAGVFLGLMLFSSPTAAIYLPYILGVFVYRTLRPKNANSLRPIFLSAAAIFTGALMIFLLFTLPDPIENIKGFRRFLQFSQTGNNFNIYYDLLYQYYPIPEGFRGEGIRWIFKYFFLITPILFTGYWLSAGYLLKKSFQKPWLLSVILLTLLPPAAVEISRVAQFGRNYFPWLIGLIFLNCLAIHILSKEMKRRKTNLAQITFVVILAAFLAGHLLFNARLFFDDVFPSKMATTWVHQWLIKNGHDRIYVYADHPFNKNLVRFLNNPKQKEKITVQEIQSLREAADGLVYLLPVTGKAIYRECRENDFYKDPDLTHLYQSPEFSKYALASFKTFASSKVWTQEEEICTYLDLSLGLITDEDRQKGFAYLLDGAKLQKEWPGKK